MSLECPDCGAGLTGADRDGDGYRCGRCGAQVREPRRTRDYDDRPTRRRRPPKRGNGRVVLLVVVGVGVLMLLACGGIGGSWYVAAQPRWEEFRSPNGGYTVSMPAKARPDMGKIVAKQGGNFPGVTFEGTLLLARLEEYCIAYGELPPGPRGPGAAERVIDAAVDGMKNGPQPAQVVSSRPVTVSGYQGREVELRIKTQARLARIVVTPTRVYTVIAGGPFTGTGEPRVRRFVESFQLTEPNPAGGGNAPPPFVPRRR
ncbi:hypothetical protein [Urbifossiella limnaea]|uniref:Uncharacterized protein n=1 Tax=Urbifossiella limnaea TaxID=2528023 RepID=A0A517XRQ4_9BACT|nr:hypothetical protein [Urbifossiella limnaea]QDU20187.1 hypothetical protein ETAA1_21320 [Urbifossiella limnaea]